MVRPSLRERQKTKYTVDPIGDHERDSNRSEDGEGEGEYEESYSPGAGESPPSSPDGDSEEGLGDSEDSEDPEGSKLARNEMHGGKEILKFQKFG